MRLDGYYSVPFSKGIVVLLGGSRRLHRGLVLFHFLAGEVDDVLAIGNDAVMLLLRSNDELLPLSQARTSRDEVSTDDILLHTLKEVGLTTDSSLVEHLGRLLEGSGTHEALRTKGSTGDTLENLRGRSRARVADLYLTEVTTLQHTVLVAQLAHGDDLTYIERFGVTLVSDHLLTPDTVVLSSKVELVHQIQLQEGGVARIVDLYLAHHLANDDLEVLVIDLHTLQTVHILYLVDDIFLDSRETLDGKDIGRRDDTVRKWRASTHSIMLLDKDLLGEADEVLALLARLRRDDNLAITTLHLAQLNLAIDFADDSRVGRVASLEKLRDTRQTTSDITSTTHRTRNLDQRLTRGDERTLGEGRL